MSSRLVTNPKNKHLLLTLDAFGTLYRPRTSISATYARIAENYGIQDVNEEKLAVAFKKAFKSTSTRFPNYGKALGMTLHEWWTGIIRDSFKPVTSRPIDDAMIRSLMSHFSGKEAYFLFDDVLPFFALLKDMNGKALKRAQPPQWPWKSTTVGIITNSDNRVATILTSLGLTSRDESKNEADNISSDISFIIASYVFGIEKPNARIFHAARDAFAQLPSSAGVSEADVVKIHVGDDLEKDALGALGAGWTPIFLDREGKFLQGKGEDRQENLTIPVIHPVTHEEKEVSLIRSLSDLQSGLLGINF